jgi:hypothetical protein
MKKIVLLAIIFGFCSTVQAGMFDQIKGITDTLEKVTTPAKQPARQAPASAAPDKEVPDKAVPDKVTSGVPGRTTSPLARPRESKEVWKLRGEFSNAYWKHRGSIEFFMQYYDNPDKYFDYGSQTLAKAKPAFKEINEGCTTRFQGVTDDSWGDRLKRWSVWCKMAAEGDEWIKRAVTMKAAFYVNQLTQSFEKQSKTLADSKGSLGTWDQKYYLDPVERKAEFFKFMEKDFKFVGMERPPDEVFAKADTALAKLLGEIKEQVKNWPCYPDGTPMADAFVQKSFLTGIKGSKFLKNYRQSVGWEVTVNALGVPQYRKIGGKAIFKLPNETWCRSQYYTYFQDYQGKGYGQSYFKHGPSTGLSSVCDCR